MTYPRKEQIDRLLAEIAHQSSHYTEQEPERDSLFGVPPLLEGEAFSSWCWRIQQKLRVPYKDLRSLFRLKVPPFWIDAGRSNVDWEHIAKVVKQPLSAFIPLMWQKRSLLSVRGLACLTTSPLAGRPIYRYCESCLQGDRDPYIRQLWRFVGMYVCPIHNSALRDLCPHCQKSFIPGRVAGNSRRPLRICGHCKKDICAVTPVLLPVDLHNLVMQRQAELLRTISDHPGITKLAHLSPDNEKAMNPVRINIEEGHLFLQNICSLNLVKIQYLGNRQSYLEHRDFGSQEPWRSHMMYVGLDGEKLFSHQASSIAAILHGVQDLWAGTFWWSRWEDAIIKPSAFDERDFSDGVGWGLNENAGSFLQMRKFIDRKKHRKRQANI